MDMNNENESFVKRNDHPLRYKVYIAGPVTGLDYDVVFKKFSIAENMLLKLGQQVVNPMREVTRGTDWHNSMRICIPLLYDCNAIYLLPNWQKSKGARVEYFNANMMGFKMVNEMIIDEIKIRIETHESKFNKEDAE